MKQPMEGSSGEGFVRTTRPAIPNLTDSQRIVLIRKGNEFFNQGKIEEARRIFITTGYGDGLIRVGNHYRRNNRPLEAFSMYCLAPDEAKKARMVREMASVVRGWLNESQ